MLFTLTLWGFMADWCNINGTQMLPQIWTRPFIDFSIQCMYFNTYSTISLGSKYIELDSKYFKQDFNEIMFSNCVYYINICLYSCFENTV